MYEKSRILVVEDDPDDRALMKRATRNAPVPVELEFATTGDEALSVLSSHTNSSLPRVILLDLHLPGMSGIDLLRRLRKNRNWRFIPVVILSSSSLETDMTHAYEKGANSYLRKPLELRQFDRMVKTLITYWCEDNLQLAPR